MASALSRYLWGRRAPVPTSRPQAGACHCPHRNDVGAPGGSHVPVGLLEAARCPKARVRLRPVPPIRAHIYICGTRQQLDAGVCCRPWPDPRPPDTAPASFACWSGAIDAACQHQARLLSCALATSHTALISSFIGMPRPRFELASSRGVFSHCRRQATGLDVCGLWPLGPLVRQSLK